MSAGLVVFLAFFVIVPFILLARSCSDEELAVFEEFPQYAGGQEIEPEPSSGACIVRFTTAEPEEEVFRYYVEGLQEDGWEIEIVPQSVSELVESTEEDSSAARVVASTIRARRDAYQYGVAYRQQAQSDEGRVIATVAEGRQPSD